MTSALILTAVVAAVQQPAIPGTGVSALLAAARTQMSARELDSAAVLLRQVTQSSEAGSAERMEAWVLLAVVGFYAAGDSAAAGAFREALAIDPHLEVDELDPAIASILERERAALRDMAAPAPPAAEPQVHSCIVDCPDGVEPPRFTFFPSMEFVEAAALSARRMRTYVTFRAVIDADGRIDPSTLQVSGGSARGMESQVRRGLAQARFAPGRSRGIPVATLVTLRFDFVPEGTCCIRYRYRVGR